MCSRRSIVLSLILVYCLTVGCAGRPPAPQGVIVTGRIVNNGQPLELIRPEVGLGMIQITLIPVDGGGVGGHGSQANKDGIFEVRGPGKGIPPKKYKLAVQHWKNGVGTKDELEERFAPEKTPIIVEIPSSAVGSTYDLEGIELMDYIHKESSEALQL